MLFRQRCLRFAHRLRLIYLSVATMTFIFTTAAIAQSTAQSAHYATMPETRVAAVQPVTVAIEGFQFKPKALTVKRGTTVTFVNKDATPHTVTPKKDATFISTGRLQKNDSKPVTFNQVGVQRYFCAIHPSMKGQVTVRN
jgi:plastocyanin